ncbi:MAG TPA: acyltransferase domain-containing protein, partial [Candidatus Elarobacter sp.]|nr:acyltransferase domain-containing protein [Candidatus Elarobacter sp.]
AATLDAERPIEILTLSARSEAALRALAQRYAARLEAQPAQWADLCHTANVGRAPFAHQLSVRGADAAALRTGLASFLAGTDDARVVVSRSTTVRPQIGFLFTGQGAQYAGMGRALYAASPAVRRIVDAADALLAGRLGAPLGAVMRGEHPDAARLINLTLYTQPALYVLEYALAELLRELGVEPQAVIGHSLGEYVAAAVTGIFSFEDGLLLVADRAKLMHEVTADGAMLVVSASEEQIAPVLHGYDDRVSVAGVNAPSQVTISGARAAIEEIAAVCVQRGWRTVPLPVSQAFHSPLLEEMSVAFETRAAQLSYAPPNRKLVSNLTGTTVDGVDAAYWRAHTRRAVRFADGVRALDELGCDVLVEIGPRPTLLPLAQQIHGSAGARRYVATLKGAGQDWDSLAHALQQLHAAGVTIDWAAWDRNVARSVVDAPTYPFERRRHWITPSKRRPATAARATASGAHPLLGARLRSALPGAQFEAGLITAGGTAWLGDHRINGSALLPATALIEIMLAAGAACDPPLSALSDLAIFAPLRVGDEPRTVQTIVDAPAGDSATVRIFAADDDDRFRLHAQGRLTAASVAGTEASADLAAIRARCTDERNAEQHYARMAESGADFGPAFLGVARMWSGEGEALAEVHATVGAAMDGTQRPHPALLDACLQTAAGALAHGGATYMPITLARLDLLATSWPETVFSNARVIVRSEDEPQLDLTVYAADGTPLARARALTFKRIDGAVARDDAANQSSWFYDLAWRKTPVPAPAAPSNAPALVIGSGPLADGIAAALRTAGRSVDLHAAADAERSIAELNGRAQSAGVVVCVSPEPHDPSDDGPLSGRAGVETLLALCKHHAGSGAFGGARLYVVTRTAHAVEPGDAPALADAALSGLAATALTEFPELRCTRVDVDPANTAAAGTDVAREIVAAADDDWVAYRHG